MRILANILFLLLLHIDTSAQFSFIKNITIDDGLNSNEAVCTMQDSRGFIWIASSTSVQRYDGYEFVTFYENSTGEYCLNEAPQVLFEASDGAIWLGTTKGLYRFSYHQEAFEEIDILQDKNSNFNIIDIVTHGDENTLTIVTKNSGVFSIDIHTKHTVHAFSDYNGEIIASCKKKNGSLFIATFPHSLYEINIDKKSIALVNDTLRVKNLISNIDNSLLIQCKDGNSYVLDNSLFYRNEKYDMPVFDIVSLQRNGKMVGCVKQDFVLVEHNKGRVCTYSLPEISNYVNSPLHSIFIDAEDNVWVCTKTRGIFLFSHSSSWHELLEPVYLANSKKTIACSVDTVVAFITDSLVHVFSDTVLEKPTKTIVFNKKIDPTCAIMGPKSMVYIGALNELVRVNLETDSTQTITFDSKIVALSLFNNYLWIGTSNSGLWKMALPGGKIETVKSIITDSAEKSMPDIITSIAHTNTELWIGSCEGIFVLNSQTLAGVLFDLNTLNPECLNNTINSIVVDDSNKVWIGSNNGISYFMRADSSFVNVKPKGNFRQLYVEHISLQNSMLFLSSNRGLIVLKDNANFHIASSTIIFDRFAYAKPYKLPNGMIVLLNKNSMLKINPNKYPLNNHDIPVYLTSLRVFNETIENVDGNILTENILSASKITLSHADNFFTLIFSGLKYSNSKNIEYKYKLEGVDSDYRYTNSKNRYASYANLSPGEYTFCISAGIAGNFDSKKHEVIIAINPPFWSTSLFKSIVLIFVLAAVYLFLLLREKRISKLNEMLNEKVESQTVVLKKQNDELIELNNTKDKFMSIIAHDLKNPLNSLIGFTELLHEKHAVYDNEQRQKFIDIINNASKQMYGLLTNLFDWSRTQTGKIQFQPQEFNIQSSINGTLELLKHVANKKGVAIESNSFKAMVFADKNMITTTIRNLVSNSIKFTPKGGLVVLSCKQNDNYIVISVSDNGVGMDAEQMESLFKIDKTNSTLGTDQEHGTGLGLILCKEFIKMNKGNIAVESEKGKGSTFSFTVPLS